MCARGWEPRLAIAAGVVYAGAQFDITNQGALLLGLVTLAGAGGLTSLALASALVLLGCWALFTTSKIFASPGGRRKQRTLIRIGVVGDRLWRLLPSDGGWGFWD